MWRRDPDGIATGDRVDPPSGPWDDAFGGVRTPPRLSWPGGPALELHSSHDVWVVFDERNDVVCVEPQTAPPDAFNAVTGPRADVLSPGEELALEMSVRWIEPRSC
jgi:galactose mutarotase-like enzyme